MSNGIEKQKLENQIRLSYYKHRGDVFAISQELQVPEEYVIKIAKKIKNRQKRDADFLISSTIMEHLILGSNQRNKTLTELLAKLDKHLEKEVSHCCYATIEVRAVASATANFCSECGQRCSIENRLDTECVTLVNETIENLRGEDDSLVKFADKLGFTNKEEQPTNKITQYNISLNNGKVDENIQKDILKLSGAERTQLRKSIESAIIDGKK